MPSNEYRFVTVWKVAGMPDEVFAVLDDPADLVRWWPSVYLDVVVEEPCDERGIGKVVSVLTKGWLPYRLRWRFRVTRRPSPAASPWTPLAIPTGRRSGRSPRRGRWPEPGMTGEGGPTSR